MNRLSKKQRNFLYKKAISKLKHFDNPDGYQTTMCSAIGLGIKFNVQCPEFELFRFENRVYNQFWMNYNFQNYESNQDHRANCLMLMYEMSK